MVKNKTRIIDLTHSIQENIPLWPGAALFSQEICQTYAPGKFRVHNYHLAAGTGTHMDAPFHCEEHGKSVADFNLDELIGVGCILDISIHVNKNPDYVITAQDIQDWESEYGQIPERAIVIANTGWSQYWEQPPRYTNIDENGILHFPGFGETAAELLVQRGILGVGIDTLSLDPGISQTYPAHHIFLSHHLFQLENVANTHLLPATGAIIFALPLKIRHGPEAPARVFAILSG